MDSTSLLAGASRPKLLPEGPVPTALQPGSAGVQQSIRCTHIQQVPASGQVRQQRQSRCGSCAVPGVRFRMTGAARGVPGKPHRGPPRLWDVRRDRRRKLKSGRNSTTDRAQEDQARLARWHAGRAQPTAECGVGIATVCCRSGTRGNLVGEYERRDQSSSCPGPDKLTGTIRY
jgi:hypothetical protein